MEDELPVDPRRCASRCATSIGGRDRPASRLPLPHGPRARGSPRLLPAPSSTAPDRAVESFAGVANPFSLQPPVSGRSGRRRRLGGGFDTFIAAGQVGPTGRVVGIDMTSEMMEKSRETAELIGLSHVEFRRGSPRRSRSRAGGPTSSSRTAWSTWPDKAKVLDEINRVLKPAVACSSPTSPTVVLSHRRRSATSTSGLPESRRAAPCGLAEDARRQRIHRREDWRASRHVRRSDRRRERPGVRRARLPVPRPETRLTKRVAVAAVSAVEREVESLHGAPKMFRSITGSLITRRFVKRRAISPKSTSSSRRASD